MRHLARLSEYVANAIGVRFVLPSRLILFRLPVRSALSVRLAVLALCFFFVSAGFRETRGKTADWLFEGALVYNLL